jgi:hypothetical protein
MQLGTLVPQFGVESDGCPAALDIAADARCDWVYLDAHASLERTSVVIARVLVLVLVLGVGYNLWYDNLCNRSAPSDIYILLSLAEEGALGRRTDEEATSTRSGPSADSFSLIHPHNSSYGTSLTVHRDRGTHIACICSGHDNPCGPSSFSSLRHTIR